MPILTWDVAAERRYETGVDRGVLYSPDEAGAYSSGVVWNGLVNVTESPSGAEANKQYADNIVYINLISVEEFGGTIEAFSSPEEFDRHDGTVAAKPGVYVGQQSRDPFGFCYRTRISNALDSDAGYKLHLIYGAQASPSEKAYGTINDSPEAVTLSWEFTTSPTAVANLKPTAIIIVDSTKVAPADLATLEALLYGSVADDPELPTPDDVIALFTTP